MKLLLALFVSFLSITARGQAFEVGKSLWCINYNSKLVIVSKIAPKQYEVYFRDPMTGQGRGHMMLFTTNTTFDSDGLVGDDLWAKASSNNTGETMKVDGKDGFTKKMEVLRESTDCETKWADKLKHPTAEQIAAKQARDDEAKQDAIIMDQSSAVDGKASLKLSPEKQKESAEKEDADRQAASVTWYSKPMDERIAICKEKGIVMEGESTSCY